MHTCVYVSILYMCLCICTYVRVRVRATFCFVCAQFDLSVCSCSGNGVRCQPCSLHSFVNDVFNQRDFGVIAEFPKQLLAIGVLVVVT